MGGLKVLSRLDAAGQRGEVEGGVSRVRALTGQTSVPFCYPYGHPHTYNAEAPAILGKAGYGLAFDTVRRLADPAADSRLEAPRDDSRDVPPFVDRLADAEVRIAGERRLADALTQEGCDGSSSGPAASASQTESRARRD